MFSVLACIQDAHDLMVIAFATCVAVIGAAVFFSVLHRAQECADRKRNQWLAMAGVAGGACVWATHFIVMLSNQNSLPILFDLAMTTTSLTLSIAAFWGVALIAPYNAGLFRAILTGILAGLGIAAMHFTGLLAIKAAAHLEFDILKSSISVILGVGFSCAAFIMFSRLAGWWQILWPALLLLLGICSLHLTGMSGTILVPDPTVDVSGASFNSVWLITQIAVIAVALIVVAMVTMLIDRHMSELQSLSDASLEGLIFVRDGQIAHVNGRFAAMTGQSESFFIGAQLENFLSLSNGVPLSSLTAVPQEATLNIDERVNFVAELAAHAIRYRGQEMLVVAVRDIRDRKEAQRQIEFLAQHDPLTGLLNRAAFDVRLAEVVDWAQRCSEKFAVLSLDLDRFKAVNDLFGHAAGDRILCRVADILCNVSHATNTVARLGGDEFVILQIGGKQPLAAQTLAKQILQALAQEMNMARDPMAVGVSIGVALFPLDGQSGESVRQASDIALYRAKNIGRGAACFFDTMMDKEVRERRALEHDLRHAIVRGQLSLVYQPLVKSDTGHVCGYEALLRWQHPDFGAVSPSLFIPIAEESGSIVQLGEWALERACREAATWPDHLFVAVNVSAVQFQLPNLVEVVQNVLEKTGLAPERLELEITETVLMRDPETTLVTLNRLKALGIEIAMDDFGTGYSSLSTLHRFPFNKIKIDRSFIAALDSDGAANSIVCAIIALGQSLNMVVLAEGVETREQQALLVGKGCAQSQGYYFGRPSEAPDFSQLLRLEQY